MISAQIELKRVEVEIERSALIAVRGTEPHLERVGKRVEVEGELRIPRVVDDE